MKKVLLLMAMLTIGLASINAQDNLRWGATVGMNSSNFSITGFDSKIGFHAGVKAEVGLPQISEGVYLDMGALLTLKGAKIDGGSAASIKFNPYYLEIPVHIGYKYAVNENFAIFGNAGPYLAIGLFGKAKAEGDILDEYEFDDNSTNVFGDDAMKRFDFGLGLKAGVEFIIRKTKCFDFWERNVLFPKTKRSFFRTPKHPLPCPFPLNFSLLIITKKFGNLAKNRYICIV